MHNGFRSNETACHAASQRLVSANALPTRSREVSRSGLTTEQVPADESRSDLRRRFRAGHRPDDRRLPRDEEQLSSCAQYVPNFRAESHRGLSTDRPSPWMSTAGSGTQSRSGGSNSASASLRSE
jgi:hypothetical protein